MQNMHTFIRAAASLATIALSLTACQPHHAPRLAGYGCSGAIGTLYADEESDLPPCKRIERLTK